MFDRLLSFISILLLLPLLLALALLIKRDSPGPVFYRGPRVGKNGRPFKILKFRTMYEEDKSYAGPRITAHGDARITPFGQWLRDTKLNELPQFWNVLLGDMSLVGPRPEDPEIIRQWPDDLRSLLLSVKPGITSPASVAYHDEEAQLSSENVLDDYLRSILPTKLRLDSLYIRNRTLLSDLDVLFWTLMVLIPRARQVPAPDSLYWGPFSLVFSRFVNWFVIDFAISLLSVSLVAGIWRGIAPLDLGWSWGLITAVGIAVMFSFFNVLMRNHLVYWRKASPREALDLFIATVLAMGTIFLVDHLLIRQIDIPDGLYIVGGLLACAGFIAARYRERILTGLAYRWLSLRKTGSTFGEPVLVVGAGELGEFAAWLVRKSDLNRAFSIVGMVDDDPSKRNLRFSGIRILGACRDIPELVKKHDPGLILFAISKIDPADRERILELCRQTGVRMVMVPDILKMMQKYFRRATSISDSDTSSRDRPHVKAGQVGAWLAEIEKLIAAGDANAARERIAQYKNSLREQE